MSKYEDSRHTHIICPYCGEPDGWEMRPGKYLVTCSTCHNRYDLSVYANITYSTNRIDDMKSPDLLDKNYGFCYPGKPHQPYVTEDGKIICYRCCAELEENNQPTKLTFPEVIVNLVKGSNSTFHSPSTGNFVYVKMHNGVVYISDGHGECYLTTDDLSATDWEEHTK